MATTENTYTANGTQSLYSFTFPYIDESDVKVSLDSVIKTKTTDYTFASATQIQFNTAPTASAAIRIYRSTDTERKKATYFSGSAIRSQDLNENFDQTLYISQELVRDVGNIWDDTTETIASTETWPATGDGNDTTIATTAAITARIVAGAPTVSGVETIRVDGGNTMTGTNALKLPAGTDAERPTGVSSPAVADGMFRYNTESNAFEGYASGAWGAVGGGTTGPDAASQCFWENDQTVNDNYTITNNKNAGSFGPITIVSGKAVTVDTGEVWTVV